MPDWNKIKAEYIRGGISCRELAEKHGVPFGTITKVCTNESWADLRKKAGEKMDKKLVESTATKEAKRVDKIDAIADSLLELIENEIRKGSVMKSARGFRDVSGALKDLRELKGGKFDKEMAAMDAQIKKLQNEAKAEEESNDIRVTMDDDSQNYAK